MTIGDVCALLGGAICVIGIGKLVFSSGEIKRIVIDTHASVAKIDATVEEHGERILTLELLNGLNGDRRQSIRRDEDLHFRDVRKTMTRDEP
jgi:hypothetical protein